MAYQAVTAIATAGLQHGLLSGYDAIDSAGQLLERTLGAGQFRAEPIVLHLKKLVTRRATPCEQVPNDPLYLNNV
jgi:hypothetical protein